jgi:hypothetical protein
MRHDPGSEYATKARKAPVVVYKRKPFAAVIPLGNADNETLALSTNRKFLKIIDRSRARVKREGGISAGKLRRHLGLENNCRLISRLGRTVEVPVCVKLLNA